MGVALRASAWPLSRMGPPHQARAGAARTSCARGTTRMTSYWRLTVRSVPHQYAFRPIRLRWYLGKPCPYCGVTMNRDRGWNSRDAPSRDHRIPQSRGGKHNAVNITVCCRMCNEEKGSLDPEEFTAVRAGLASRLDHRWHAERSRAMNPRARRREPDSSPPSDAPP